MKGVRLTVLEMRIFQFNPEKIVWRKSQKQYCLPRGICLWRENFSARSNSPPLLSVTTTVDWVTLAFTMLRRMVTYSELLFSLQKWPKLENIHIYLLNFVQSFFINTLLIRGYSNPLGHCLSQYNNNYSLPWIIVFSCSHTSEAVQRSFQRQTIKCVDI